MPKQTFPLKGMLTGTSEHDDENDKSISFELQQFNDGVRNHRPSLAKLKDFKTRETQPLPHQRYRCQLRNLSAGLALEDDWADNIIICLNDSAGCMCCARNGLYRTTFYSGVQAKVELPCSFVFCVWAGAILCMNALNKRALSRELTINSSSTHYFFTIKTGPL